MRFYLLEELFWLSWILYGLWFISTLKGDNPTYPYWLTDEEIEAKKHETL